MIFCLQLYAKTPAVQCVIETRARHAWAHQVQLDFAELRPYARAAYASTDKYFDALPDDALDQPRGKLPASVLNALLLNLSMRRGEIACLHALEC
jgi:hypothetical protein